MGQWITSPERIIQPFQTVNEVTWTFNLLEAMEFVGILCMSMWLTTFFFTPKIRKVTHMLVSFITVNNSSLKNQPNNGDLLTDIRTKTTWICAYVIWTPHQYFMELHSIGINYQIGPVIWIITTLSLFIFPRWNLSIYFDFNLNCPLYNSAVLSLCLCLPLSFSVALTSFRSDRVCIHGVSETVQHIRFAAEIMSIFVSSLIQDRSYHSTLSTSPQLRLHRANSNGIIQQKQCS